MKKYAVVVTVTEEHQFIVEAESMDAAVDEMDRRLAEPSFSFSKEPNSREVLSVTAYGMAQ